MPLLATLAALGGALAGAGGISGAISGGITARKQRKADAKFNEQQRKWELEDQERARKWQLEDELRQNAYMSPEQEMARLKEAGLNPNLVYGSGATSHASASQPPPPVKGHDSRPLQYKDVAGQVPGNIAGAISDIMGIRNARLAGDRLELENASMSMDNAVQAAVLEDIIKGKKSDSIIKREKASGAQKQHIVDWGGGIDDALVWLPHQADPSIRSGKEIDYLTKGQMLINREKDTGIKEQMLKNLHAEGTMKEFEASLTELGLSPNTMKALSILYMLLRKK